MELESADYDDAYQSDVLPNGTTLLNGQYVIEKYLSSGGFGITYFARDSLDRRVVIKECFPEAYCSRKSRTVMARSQSHQVEFRSIVDMFMREAHSIAKLSHPHIVGVHQVFQDNETAYMALDLIDGKDLLDVIDECTETPLYEDVKSILLKVLDAIATVHDQDMLHRDISPDNILLDASDNPVLIDFGAAREEASKKSRALSAVLVVKDGYSPQEFYVAGSRQTPCSDLYALAATFYHLITGQAPPHSQTRVAALASERPDPCTPLAGHIDGYPRAFLEAIDDAMSVFPQDRIQTARDWTLRIDESTRRAIALAQAANDADIEKTVMQLIEDAQREAENATAGGSSSNTGPTVPNARPDQPKKHKLDPKSEALPHGVKAVEEIPPSEPVDENMALERDINSVGKRFRSDWIARARAKQTITRIDLYDNTEVLEEEPEVWHDNSMPWLVLGVTVGLLALCVLLLGTTDILLPLLTWIMGSAETGIVTV